MASSSARRPLPFLHCSAAVSLRPLAIKAEWRVTSHLKRRRNLLLFSTSWRPRSNFVAVCESTLQHSSRQVGKCHKSRGRRVRLSCFLSAVLTPPYSLPPFPSPSPPFLHEKDLPFLFVKGVWSRRRRRRVSIAASPWIRQFIFLCP